ncbi:hypothetical protein M0R45_035291 [Rubus argutus]|uniref:Uncharacterized protein n=1 Tax=Rubus argutus TaxID=59490 RepID=A0AAW1VUD3_RUBAR
MHPKTTPIHRTIKPQHRAQSLAFALAPSLHKPETQSAIPANKLTTQPKSLASKPVLCPNQSQKQPVLPSSANPQTQILTTSKPYSNHQTPQSLHHTVPEQPSPPFNSSTQATIPALQINHNSNREYYHNTNPTASSEAPIAHSQFQSTPPTITTQNNKPTLASAKDTPNAMPTAPSQTKPSPCSEPPITAGLPHRRCCPEIRARARHTATRPLCRAHCSTAAHSDAAQSSYRTQRRRRSSPSPSHLNRHRRDITDARESDREEEPSPHTPKPPSCCPLLPPNWRRRLTAPVFTLLRPSQPSRLHSRQ